MSEGPFINGRSSSQCALELDNGTAMVDDCVVIKPDKAQRTLFSLAKVVRLENPSVCFSQENITKLKETLLDVTQTTHQLLIALRKLDCYRLQLEDVQTSGIGQIVATLAHNSPKPAVSRLASSILLKWKQMIDDVLFRPIADYDVKAAEEAPEGEPEAPEDEIAAIKVQKRMEKLERRRLRDEQGIRGDTSSDSEAAVDEIEEDPDWAPQQGPQRAARRSSRRRSSSE